MKITIVSKDKKEIYQDIYYIEVAGGYDSSGGYDENSKLKSISMLKDDGHWIDVGTTKEDFVITIEHKKEKK